MVASLRFRLALLALILAVIACNGVSAPSSGTSSPVSGGSSPSGGSPSQVTSAPPPTAAPAYNKQRVTFTGGKFTLVGYLYKPDGNGPFPGLIWNHGSDPDPDSLSEFDAVAQIVVPAGYVLFAPLREGQGGSQGTSIMDQVQQQQTSKGDAAAQQLFVSLMQGSQLDDQLAGLAYLKSLTYVDKDRLEVAGCSYGGIQSILAAAKGAGYKSAVAISPGSDSWDSNKSLQSALTNAVSSINIPVFLIHPEKDVSVQPGYTLAAQFLKLNKAYSLKIYPPFGSAAEQGICFGGAQGDHWWASDVLTFLQHAFTPTADQPDTTPKVKGKQITLVSDGLDLVGDVYKPAGQGPFPAIIWNHGSEQNPTAATEFDRVASLFVAAGYVVVTPARRGQGGSQGEYISDSTKAVFQSKGKAAAEDFLVQQMAGPQLDDQLSGLTYLQSLPYVDQSRLAVVGCSYGGMQTLWGAASGKGYKAAVAISPGAESWNANPLLQQALIKLMSNINIPTLIIHPAHDASLAPGFALGPQLQQLGKTYGLQIFPPFGTSVDHCFGGGTTPGNNVWGPAALSFLSSVLH
jgi:carboxymethylenebutenolidase